MHLCVENNLSPNGVPLKHGYTTALLYQVQKTCQGYMQKLRLRRESDLRHRAEAEGIKLKAKVGWIIFRRGYQQCCLLHQFWPKTLTLFHRQGVAYIASAAPNPRP